MPNAETKLTIAASYLIKDGLLTPETAIKNLTAAQAESLSLTQYLVKTHTLPSEIILSCYHQHTNLPIFDLKKWDYEKCHLPWLKPELIRLYRILPLQCAANELHLGLSDPTDDTILNTISFITGRFIQPILVAEIELDTIIKTYYDTTILDQQLEATLSKMEPVDIALKEPDEKIDEPIIAFVDHLLHDAVQKKASDIHIEPYEHHCRIRFRCDGLLFEAASIPSHLATRIITRLKIMANLNIAERRLPQDGRMQLLSDTAPQRKIDIRISTCPTLFGEKLVLRLLKSTVAVSLTELGLNSLQYQHLSDALQKPQGLVLVTGPTGSGKTMTLYAALQYLNQIEKNICSIEDPVEIELPGINQVNIHAAINLNFATVLRAFLRQDPDIIMVGEIRDSETASIAMQAAQTGHLVLSTLHTKNALETIIRLQSMNIPHYQLTQSISLVIAQRLIRLLCPHCKTTKKGCDACLQGYQGRTGIFEVIPFTESLTHSLQHTTQRRDILNILNENGHLSLRAAGLEKVEQGLTDYAEILRVTEA